MSVYLYETVHGSTFVIVTEVELFQEIFAQDPAFVTLISQSSQVIVTVCLSQAVSLIVNDLKNVVVVQSIFQSHQAQVIVGAELGVAIIQFRVIVTSFNPHFQSLKVIVTKSDQLFIQFGV